MNQTVEFFASDVFVSNFTPVYEEEFFCKIGESVSYFRQEDIKESV